MGYYSKTTVISELQVSVGTVSYGRVGIVGYMASNGTATLNTAYVIDQPNTAKTLFGITSALYKSILKLFENGATEVIAVPAQADAATPETFSGDDTTKVFTLTGDPTQSLTSVTVTAVPQVEGTDFTVDYGNKTITFVTAPVTGVDNIVVGFDEHTVAYITAALVAFDTENIDILLGAMIFDSAMLTEIMDNAVAFLTDTRYAVFMQPNGIATTTLATTLASLASCVISHNFLVDVAACFAGKLASLRPWEDITFKTLSGLGTTQGKFTPTEFNALDAAKIIVIRNPPKDASQLNRVSKGYNLDSGGNYPFIDQIRTAFFLDELVETGVTNQKVIGTMRMNRSGLRELNAYLRSLLNPQIQAGAIDSYTIYNPALNLFEKNNPTEAEQAEIANLQSTRRIEGSYVIKITVIYSGTIHFVEQEILLTGGT